MATLQDIRQDDSLWWRVLVFLFDLRHFKKNVDSQSRLDRIVDASYLGQPYFTEDEVSMLKSTALPAGSTLADTVQATLEERLERRMKKRVESSDYRVCAAHDLAPVFETAFEVKEKDLARNERFVELLNEHSLNVPPDWRSIFKPVNKCGPKPKPGKKKPR
ncbi:hypothetical protein BDZ85DRAFT_264624 [Elsinoe ampelina]|uniref:Uncharacterized protein n=1 Tax=Elsinoe ampelina TaxID=302913 RepID=A0A6A6G980_9PEZI|nr:hypothetical protein BDZ85DRAFT_264624 [Elsinoe ampelina]